MNGEEERDEHEGNGNEEDVAEKVVHGFSI